MNGGPLRVLSLEPDAGDHERVCRHAVSAGLSAEFTRAANRAEFEAALKRGAVDLILADHCIPGYGGMEALESAQTLRPGVPYIIVSGSTGEDRAAECIRRGASDFVHKDRLDRLPEAIARATQGTAERQSGPEADLLPAQKMELVGKMAGGIAHDLNNLLTIISGYVCMLLDSDSLPPAASEPLKRVFAASHQATGVVRQLLLLRRRRTLTTEVIDLNAEVGLMAGTLRELLGRAVVVEFEPSPDSPRVSADVGMLEQLLSNLADNARDAMARGGRLTIAVGLRPPTGEVAPEGHHARTGGHASLTVRDTGCGIPAPLIPRIFEPFFTTKQEGRGTGMGLAIVQDIVRRHGGWIEVKTEVGVGTEFRIYLPLTQAELAASPGVGRGPAPTAATRTLLLVEDEPGVREFTAAVLQQDGYRLLQARSGEGALETWRWHSARIDLLLTDVVLPGELSGPQLAAKLQAEKPALRVVLTTGHGHGAAAAQAGDGAPGPVLMKPYTPRSLLKAVHEALA
ncbi:MAG TPA: response regulator [Opitutaceae bacterium]|nr:response regulator [Opitutaceae bacterium]